MLLKQNFNVKNNIYILNNTMYSLLEENGIYYVSYSFKKIFFIDFAYIHKG